MVQAFSRHISRLSSSYLDTSKDRVYIDEENSPSRRSVQTVFSHIFRVYTSVLSPIVPLLTQEAWHHAPMYLKHEDAERYFSPFVSGWFTAPEEWNNELLRQDFIELEKIMELVKGVLARARDDK